MKILFTLESFFPMHRAGTEIYVLNLCHYFKSKNWDVSVLIATSQGLNDYTHEGINVYTFDIPKYPDPKELNGLIPPRGIEDFLKKLEIIKPEIVHFHSLGRAINGYHIKKTKQLGYKTIFTPHLGSLFCIKGNMRLFNKKNCDGHISSVRCTTCLLQSKGHSMALSKIIGLGIGIISNHSSVKKTLPPAWLQAKHRKEELERINKYSDLIFSIAPWIQSAFKANKIEKSVLIPQGISSIFLDKKYILKDSHRKGESLNFIFVGRMHPFKGFHLLKKAWDNMSGSKFHNLHIITNPSGDEDAYFEIHKNWAMDKENVFWNEQFSQVEVACYLNQADILILPSLSNEVAPLVILEAATRQIPVISSDYIAMKDIVVHEENGLLFENGNYMALQKSIQRIIDDKNLLSQLKQNIKTPLSMQEVGDIVEQNIQKEIL